MTPARFETHRPMLLAGLRQWYAFSEGPDKIPVVWKDFVARLPLPGQVDGRTYGATCQTDMAGQRFEYMCAAEVERFDGLAEDLGRMRVPGGPLRGLRPRRPGVEHPRDDPGRPCVAGVQRRVEGRRGRRTSNATAPTMTRPRG